MNLQPNSFTIDSREVAEMVDKRHDHLVRDIDIYVKYIADIAANGGYANYNGQRIKVGNATAMLVSDFFIESEYESGSPVREYRNYLVTRQGCEIIANKMTGEKGIVFTIAYVAKFHEMEASLSAPSQQFRVPTTIQEALRLCADEIDRRQEAERQNQIMAPKASQFDSFMSGKNSQPMNVVAKSLGTGRTRLFAFLRDRGILMRDNTPYQRYIDSGYFEVVEKPIKMGDEMINKPQTLVTPKGTDYIGKLLAAGGNVIPMTRREVTG